MQNFRSDKKITPKYNSDGLITTVIQNSVTKKVLMVGFMNSEAFKLTLEGPDVWFYSRSRKELWKKGETSGNYLKVVDISIDCDEDALLISVNPIGPTCHNNTESCFDKEENSSEINSEIALKMLNNGTISGGMIPKINTCLNAVKNGVTGVVIVDGRKPHSILFELFSDKGAGTLIRK